MSKPLRIAVADDEVEMRQYFSRMLPRMGHEVVAVAENGQQLLELCRETHPDMIITDIKMPELDGIEAASRYTQDGPIPVILVSAFHDKELIDRAAHEQILAFLVKPIKQADLRTAIAIAETRFGEFQDLRQQALDLSQALEDRKVIEQAKGILIKQTGLSEGDSFRRLQRMSNDKNVKLVEIARSIVLAAEALGGGDFA